MKTIYSKKISQNRDENSIRTPGFSLYNRGKKKMCSNLEQNFALFFCIEYLYFRDWVITIFIFLIESRDFFLSISVWIWDASIFFFCTRLEVSPLLTISWYITDWSVGGYFFLHFIKEFLSEGLQFDHFSVGSSLALLKLTEFRRDWHSFQSF